MNPAFSVIFLTVLIGSGQGLFSAIAVQDYLAYSSNRQFALIGSSIAMLLLVAGLIASFFHLGRPFRAWRAVSMWRTSWLSREVIVLPALMGVIALFWFGQWATGSPLQPLLHWITYAGVFLSLVLYLCTGMIYACIKFIQEWATPMTVVNFALHGLASGILIAAVIARQQNLSQTQLIVQSAIVFIALSLLGWLISQRRNFRLKPVSTTQSAIGIKHRQLTQRSMGMTGGSFNTHAFFHHMSSTFIKNIRIFVLISAFLIPLLMCLLYMQWNVAVLLLSALIFQFFGLIAERWLFFAQANHPQNLYYQTVS